MGLLDGPLKGVAASVMKTLGTQITLVQVETGVFVAAQNKSTISKILHTVSAVIGEVTSGQARGNVQEGDQKFSVPAKELPDLLPTSDWYILWEEVRYNIVAVESIYASAEAVVYDLYARTPT